MGTEVGTCPGCRRHCKLSEPHCRVGREYARTGALPDKKEEDTRPKVDEREARRAELSLEERLAAQLGAAARALKRGAKTRGTQERLMSLLGKKGHASERKLIKRMHAPGGDGLEAINKLEAAGYVERRMTGRTSRKVRIELTDSGWALFKAIKRRRAELDMGDLSWEEKIQLAALLGRLQGAADERRAAKDVRKKRGA